MIVKLCYNRCFCIFCLAADTCFLLQERGAFAAQLVSTTYGLWPDPTPPFTAVEEANAQEDMHAGILAGAWLQIQDAWVLLG